MAATITVACPHCGKRMRASAEHIGRKGRCLACKALVEISAAAGESLETVRPADATRTTKEALVGAGLTEVNTWIAGLIAIAATAILYVTLFLPLGYAPAGTIWRRLGDYVLQGGWVIPVETLFACWGASLLVMKHLAVKRQLGYAELELELIPLEIGLQINAGNIDQFLGHISSLPRDHRRSILGRRIEGALEHFKSRNIVPEVAEFLNSQADIDASKVDSGYTLLRVFIWSIPLLGFVGTVMGISDAVTALKTALPQPASESAPGAAQEPQNLGDKLIGALGDVTNGLAVAFNTTLVALLYAILLMFPTESLRKTEYGMLDRIQEFTNESLLRRLSDERAATTNEQLPEIVRDALEAAFQEHQRWLAQWQAQVAQLGQVIGAEFEATVSKAEQTWSQAEQARLDRFKQTSKLLEEIFERAAQATSTWQRSGQDALGKTQATLEAVGRLQQALAENARIAVEVVEQQRRLTEMYGASDLGTGILALQREIGRLADRLSARDGDTAPGAEPVHRGLLQRWWGRRD